MKSKSLSLLAGALALLTAETSSADVVTLQPVDDAYLSSSPGEANQNYDTNVLEQFGYYASIKRRLLKFDLVPSPMARRLCPPS